jgi:hypothetical protein
MKQQRRPLTSGVKSATVVDPARELHFVLGDKAKTPAAATPSSVAVDQGEGKGQAAKGQSRVPLSTRIRSDYATALKEASLTRQLSGVMPNTVQHILEEALEPWLRAHGYLG